MSADAPIEIVPYDPAWPQTYEQERLLLLAAVGPWATGGIHHVGSTAVPGLEAKPVIDVLFGVQSLDASRGCVELLRPLGYQYAPYRPQEMHWLCKPGRSLRTHHLHLVPTGSQRFRDELLFRDTLRSQPATALEYARLKHELAATHGDDREAYTAAKADFIAQVLAVRRAV